jgi:hypothetical protein
VRFPRFRQNNSLTLCLNYIFLHSFPLTHLTSTRLFTHPKITRKFFFANSHHCILQTNKKTKNVVYQKRVERTSSCWIKVINFFLVLKNVQIFLRITSRDYVWGFNARIFLDKQQKCITNWIKNSGLMGACFVFMWDLCVCFWFFSDGKFWRNKRTSKFRLFGILCFYKSGKNSLKFSFQKVKPESRVHFFSVQNKVQRLLFVEQMLIITAPETSNYLHFGVYTCW